MDDDIEKTVGACEPCQRTQKNPPKAPIPSWTKPSAPWHTLHVDFAGPLEGRNYLVVVDAYTKWVEVRQVARPTSASVIEVLRSLFATFGIPHKVVSDNGTAFVSEEIQKFYKDNGVRYVTAAPYHPATNGQAERYVGELKRALAREPFASVELRLARFLFRQHSTVHQTTGVTPAKAMFGRELPTLLDRLVPTAESPRLTEKLPRNRQLQPGEEVMVRQFLKKPNWIPGTLVKPMGRRSWLVKCANDIIRRHLNQIRKRRLEEKANNGASATLTWGMGQEDEEPETTAPERQPDRTAPRRSNRTRRQPPRYHV